jgi:hemolysin activation/secretion protein
VIKLFAPEGATSCSFAGVDYGVKEGTVEVPAAAAEALLAHGYATSRAEVKALEAAPGDLGVQLTAAKVEAAELRGSVDAMKAERDALAAKVKELEAAAGKKR